MRLSTAVDNQIKNEIGSKAKLQVGLIRNYNPRTRTIDIETTEGGNTMLYSSVLLPSLGTGFRPSDFEEGTQIVFGFIGESRELPVILSILTGNGIGPTEAKDVSIMGRVGRLYVGQHL